MMLHNLPPDIFQPSASLLLEEAKLAGSLWDVTSAHFFMADWHIYQILQDSKVLFGSFNKP